MIDEPPFFTSGFNLECHAPDMIPHECATFAEAKAALIDELLWFADHAEDSLLADELSGLAENVNLWTGPDSVVSSDDTEWWIRFISA
jgi:hypothetical protein